MHSRQINITVGLRFIALMNFVASLAFAEGCALTDEFSWVAIGDWGKAGRQQRSVVDRMAIEAANISAQFALLLGDNFYPRGVSTWEDNQFATAYEDVFVASSLQIPHFAILGNHDYLQNPQAQIDRHYKANSEWTMPHRWYTREFTIPCQSKKMATVLFVFIDTMVLSEGHHDKVTLEQRKEHWGWLQDTLREALADWIIVVGHHPVYSNGMHGDTRQLVNELKPLLDGHGVDVYLSGHEHNLQMLSDGRDSPTYIVSGSGSKLRISPRAYHHKAQFVESAPGFVSTRLNGTHLHTSWISDAGVLLHEHVQLRRDKQQFTSRRPVVAPLSNDQFGWLTPCVVALILVLSCLTLSILVRKHSKWQHAGESMVENQSIQEPYTYSQYFPDSERSANDVY